MFQFGNNISHQEALVEASKITDSEKNLRSKIESLLRSLENLSAKKLRLEFEIKKQKASLERKRRELKRSSKSHTVKMKIALESTSPERASSLEEVLNKQRSIDSRLLQISDQVLNQD